MKMEIITKIDWKKFFKELEQELPKHGCECHPEMSKLLNTLRELYIK